MLTYSITEALEDEEINPQEEAELREVVQAALVSCLKTTVQSAVVTAKMVKQQDWSQEGRKLLREYGMEPLPAPMQAARLA
jgi:aconitase A